MRVEYVAREVAIIERTKRLEKKMEGLETHEHKRVVLRVAVYGLEREGKSLEGSFRSDGIVESRVSRASGVSM